MIGEQDDQPVSSVKRGAGPRKKSHRRSAWACDECRLRKRKCDGQQPCRSCRALQIECGSQSRRPTLAPTQRIRLLEQHLRYAVSFLQELPDRLRLDTDVNVKPVLKALQYWESDVAPPLFAQDGDDESQRSQICSMLTGCNRLISPAPWKSSFYGTLSELSFILRTLELFDKGAYSPQRSLGPATDIFNRDPLDAVPDSKDGLSRLPEKDLTLQLVRSVLDRSHIFMSFLHQTHFQSMIEFVYNEPEMSKDAQSSFLALLHHVIALGYLFSRPIHHERGCLDAATEATRHFDTGQQLLDIGRCDDLVSLQALLCGASFLISTSRIAGAHSLIGLAASAATRLGLHNGVASQMSMTQDEKEMRILVFAALVKLDLYASLILDLPKFIQDEFVNTSLHDVRELSSHRGRLDLGHRASTKHLELLRSTCKARRAVFTDSAADNSAPTVDPKGLAAAEVELHRWTREVSQLLFPLGDRAEFAIIRYDLEMASNFAQITLYRPFLHYLRVMASSSPITKTQSRHALACIKLASTTILRSEALRRDHPDLPLSWESCYTVFLAVMCLVFLIAAHNGTSQPSEAWRRASTGIRILYANVCVCDCASACLEVLKMVVQQLNHTVDFDFEQIEATTSLVCRAALREAPRARSAHARVYKIDQLAQAAGARPASPVAEERFANADNVLAHAEDLPLGFGFTDLLNMDVDDERFGS